MSRRRRFAVIGGGLALAAAAAAVIVFGVVGIDQTISTGTQPRVCGVTLGVAGSTEGIRLPGVSDQTLVPGDRARVHPLCVVEILAIEDTGLDPHEDGPAARVQLRWRLW